MMTTEGAVVRRRLDAFIVRSAAVLCATLCVASRLIAKPLMLASCTACKEGVGGLGAQDAVP
jgi:hypothetical protein